MRKFLTAIILAVVLLCGSAGAESYVDFSFRDGVYFGDSSAEVKSAEKSGIMQNTGPFEDGTRLMRTYASTIWGISDSDIEYLFDKDDQLQRACISDGSYFAANSSANKRENYLKWETVLSEKYGEQLGGNYHSPIAIKGCAFSHFALYESRPATGGAIINCSERIVMLENYNIKIEHILIESSMLGSSHYISFNRFTDEDAPDWANNKTGILYGQAPSENIEEISNTSEIPYDFKKFHWGATEAEIREIEGEPIQIVEMPESNSRCMIYQTTAVGMNVGLGYIVGDAGLYSVRYTLIEEHSSALGYMEDFEKFKEALIKKYGNPVLDWEEWDSEISEEIYSKAKTLALELGYLKYHVGFDTDRTEILMLMGADNDEIDTVIVYTSKITDNPEPDYSDEI